MSYFPPSPILTQDIKSPFPRMIPIFACCAMQSSYAFIMLSYKTKELRSVGAAAIDEQRSLAQMKMLAQLYSGLQLVLEALRNYSIAYEALGGMRGMLHKCVRRCLKLTTVACYRSGRKCLERHWKHASKEFVGVLILFLLAVIRLYKTVK